MIFEKAGVPLQLRDVPVPNPSANQLLIKVSACGVCRTDLHIVDGELHSPSLPLIPGHQIVGSVEKTGVGVTTFNPGDGTESGL
jgi:propanol-preferring alcohol dehydrogenase